MQLCQNFGISGGGVEHPKPPGTPLVINQSYFYFKGKWYVRESVLTMGTVISSIFSEFHQQYVEHECSVDIVSWCPITDYVWYVADIFIITYGSK